jgi:hypothetical protein
VKYRFVVNVPVAVWENATMQDTRMTYFPATTEVRLSRAISAMPLVNCTGKLCVLEKLTSCSPKVATRPGSNPPGPNTWAM